MAAEITRPGEMGHGNANKAFTDSDAVRGGSRRVAALVNLTDATMVAKVDQLKDKVTLVWVDAESGYYRLKDITKVILNGTVTDAWEKYTLTKTDLGLNNVNNTSDANKPVSTAQQTAIDKKTDRAIGILSAALNLNTLVTTKFYNIVTEDVTGKNYPTTSGTFSGNLSVIGDESIPTSPVTQVITKSSNPVKQWTRTRNHSGIEGDPVFWEAWVETTGGGGGHTIQDEGISLAQRTKLDFKGTGVTVTDGGATPDSTIVTINAPTKADVGLGNVDNTSDANKPVSTAQATSIATKVAKGDTIKTSTTWEAVRENGFLNGVLTDSPVSGTHANVYSCIHVGGNIVTTYLAIPHADEVANILKVYVRRITKNGTTEALISDTNWVALGGASTEDVQDIVGAMNIASPTIQPVYDDVNNNQKFNIIDSSVALTKLDASLQNKIATGNQADIVIGLHSDINTVSGWVSVKGPVNTIGVTVVNTTDGSAVNFAPSATYTYKVEVKPNNATALTGTATLDGTTATLDSLKGFMQTAGSGGAWFKIRVSVSGLPAGTSVDFALTNNKYA